MGNKIIFHIPWKISEHPSASQLRPKEMLNAFIELGFDVTEVSGNNNERYEQIKKIQKDIKKGIRYQYCYSESSTSPTIFASGFNGIFTYFLIDYRLFAILKKNKVPLGLFLRDIYWRFDDYKRGFITRSGLFKYFIHRSAYWLDSVIYYMFVTILYIPSMKMLPFLPRFLQGKTVVALPSGMHENKVNVQNSSTFLKYIYTGGIGMHYEMELLFYTASKTNGADFFFSFREDEWQQEKAKYQKYNVDNIHIVHYQNEDLATLYRECDIGLIVFEPTVYREFAMPYKLFEYLSYKKPVIATEGTAVGDFVKQWDVGWVVSYSSNALMNLFQYLAKTPHEIVRVMDKIELITKDNLWTARALTINEGLCKS